MSLLSLTSLFAVPPARLDAAPQTTTFLELFHTNAEDVVQMLRDTPRFAELVAKGSIRSLAGKPHSLVLDLDDAVRASVVETIRAYEMLEIRDRINMEPVRVNYASVGLVLESLAAAGVCQVWHRTEQTRSEAQKHGNKTITHSYKSYVYAKYEPAKGSVGVPTELPEIPYVIEVPHSDPINIPPINLGTGQASDTFSLDFPDSPSTEERNRIMVVGTPAHIERIREYIDELDQPARQIMIECQIIELNANSLSDLGIDLMSGGQRHNTVAFATPLPGSPIPQPAAPFPAIEQAGLSFLFDDQQMRQSGRFMAGVHALIRDGEAIVKARPKLYTLDDRQNVLHIGEEVPTFQSTSVNRDVTGGVFVEEVSNVAKQYVGITVNVRPRISGSEANEISMLVDIQINNIVSRDRVFEEDLLGVPTVAVRSFRGQARIKNHRPLILGGLIRESDDVSNTKVPLLGDLPWIGDWMGRKSKRRERSEIILVLTPHIISESGVDPVSTPKESLHFDTFNSVLFNDRYILKGRDLVGFDPISRGPVASFTPEEVVDMTLLNIVKSRELVRKLRIFDEYLPKEAARLGFFKRTYPERSVRYWSKDDQNLYFKAAAIVVENIRNLNPGLTYDEVVSPRREIVIPTSPYHVSLSYERLKPFYEKGGEVLMRDGGVELSIELIAKLRELSHRNLREFADFIAFAERKPEHHGQFKSELIKYYYSLFPNGEPLDDLSYPDLFKELAKQGIDFLGLATYLTYRLESDYRDAPPKFGILDTDLGHFAERNISLNELADRLQQLDNRWRDLNSSTAKPVQGL